MDELEAKRIKEFMKPTCPVKIGDRIYKNYRVDDNLIFYEIIDIKELEDDEGVYYVLTGRAPNITVGENVKMFSSRYISNTSNYTIKRKGADF
jgi:hypothetical protein